MQYLYRNIYDAQCSSHDSLQHAHFVFAGAGGMGSGNGRAKSVDFRELLGGSGYIDYFGRYSATARHYYDRAGFAAGAYYRVFSIFDVARHYYAGIVFHASGT